MDQALQGSNLAIKLYPDVKQYYEQLKKSYLTSKEIDKKLADMVQYYKQNPQLLGRDNTEETLRKAIKGLEEIHQQIFSRRKQKQSFENIFSQLDMLYRMSQQTQMADDKKISVLKSYDVRNQAVHDYLSAHPNEVVIVPLGVTHALENNLGGDSRNNFLKKISEKMYQFQNKLEENKDKNPYALLAMELTIEDETSLGAKFKY